MTSLVQNLGDHVVGTVEEVTADRITVLLDPEAPHATAFEYRNTRWLPPH